MKELWRLLLLLSVYKLKGSEGEGESPAKSAFQLRHLPHDTDEPSILLKPIESLHINKT
jgi:hypothetical protein